MIGILGIFFFFFLNVTKAGIIAFFLYNKLKNKYSLILYIKWLKPILSLRLLPLSHV